MSDPCTHPDARSLYIRGPTKRGRKFLPAAEICPTCLNLVPVVTGTELRKMLS